jgi:hypothetical protein
MLRDDDPPAYRDRPPTMSEQDIRAFNQRGSQDESLVGRRRSPCCGHLHVRRHDNNASSTPRRPVRKGFRVELAFREVSDDVPCG